MRKDTPCGTSIPLNRTQRRTFAKLRRKYRGKTGVLVYRGPSRYNGKPIIAVVTWHSDNDKTGDMPQLWILADPEVYGMPTDASRSQDDDACCGDYPLRRCLGGACYVTLHQGPRSVAACFLSGGYPPADLEDMRRIGTCNLRRGAYGDAVMLPDDVLRWFVGAGGSGYTHQWRRFNHELVRRQFMASVDSPAEYLEAVAAGFRTFRVYRDDGEPLMPGEIDCPAYTRGTSCADCGLCSGKLSETDSRKNVAVPVHGALKGRF